MNDDKKNAIFSKTNEDPIDISNNEWKKILPYDVYHIAREKGTEWPFTGKYNEIHFLKAMGNLTAVADGRVFLNQ